MWIVLEQSLSKLVVTLSITIGTIKIYHNKGSYQLTLSLNFVFNRADGLLHIHTNYARMNQNCNDFGKEANISAYKSACLTQILIVFIKGEKLPFFVIL
jgi:hypothetical protein